MMPPEETRKAGKMEGVWPRGPAFHSGKWRFWACVKEPGAFRAEMVLLVGVQSFILCINPLKLLVRTVRASLIKTEYTTLIRLSKHCR